MNVIRKAGYWCAVFAAAGVILGMLVFGATMLAHHIGTGHGSQMTESRNRTPTAMPYIAAVQDYHKYLRKQFVEHSDLFDPMSAIFRNVKRGTSPLDTWCGEVDAKNRLGGYVGWVPFDMVVPSDTKAFITIYAPLVQDPDPQSETTRRLRDTVLAMHRSRCSNTTPMP